tara:strand:+ start:25733 stop:26329 length:597 start_codon:yes stop_codon:yes gene_type:complete
MNNYWDNYYSKNTTPFNNSNFAEFSKTYIKDSVMDIGCGNGRDSVYFANQGFKTLGVDGSKTAIENLKHLESEKLSFQHFDIADINSLNLNTYKNVYCRFLFHAFSEQVEDLLLYWIKNNIEEMLLIETRVMTEKDLKNSKHYRRMVNPNSFLEKVKTLNMEILFNEISTTFSPYKNSYNVNDLMEDPNIHRLVLKVN